MPRPCPTQSQRGPQDERSCLSGRGFVVADVRPGVGPEPSCDHRLPLGERPRPQIIKITPDAWHGWSSDRLAWESWGNDCDDQTAWITQCSVTITEGEYSFQKRGVLADDSRHVTSNMHYRVNRQTGIISFSSSIEDTDYSVGNAASSRSGVCVRTNDPSLQPRPAPLL